MEPPSEYIEYVDQTTGNSVFIVHPGHLEGDDSRYESTRAAFGRYRSRVGHAACVRTVSFWGARGPGTLCRSGGHFFTISARGYQFFTRCRFCTGFGNTCIVQYCTCVQYRYCTVLYLRTSHIIVLYCTCVHRILWKIHLRSGLRSVRSTAYYGKFSCVRLRSTAAS